MWILLTMDVFTYFMKTGIKTLVKKEVLAQNFQLLCFKKIVLKTSFLKELLILKIAFLIISILCKIEFSKINSFSRTEMFSCGNYLRVQFMAVCSVFSIFLFLKSTNVGLRDARSSQINFPSFDLLRPLSPNVNVTHLN